jgi:ribosomal silencing factor RsfS
MIPINKQMIVMNSLASGLCQDVLDLRSGKLSEKKAKAISQLSGKAIKSIAEGVMLANHQEVQRKKVLARNMRTEAIKKNVEFKNKKLEVKKKELWGGH